jgi:hypothetical protein
MKTAVILCSTVLLAGAAFGAPSFQGFETNTGDWVFYDGGAQSGRVASGGGILGVSSASGLYHAELVNVHDFYSSGYGTAGYSYFGGRDRVYQGSFFQSIDVYIDPAWSGQGFWIDMAPCDIDKTTLYAAEGNFRLTADGSSVNVQAINSSNLTTITTAGWYTFEMVWSKGTNPTDLINMDLNVYDSSSALLGSESFLAIFPQGTHPGQSQYLGNNSYVWLKAWQNGFANDVIAIDNVQTGPIPIPAPAAVTLCALGAGLVGWYRKCRIL